MLRIRRDLVDAMVRHARTEHPLEACGVIAGRLGTDAPTRFIPLVNAAASRTFYEVSPVDLLRLHRDLADRGEWPVVIYHSHTSTPAYPSVTDVELAGEPDSHYVLVSTRDADRAEVRSFRITGSTVTEEQVVESESVP